jgi:hypothetical protein
VVTDLDERPAGERFTGEPANDLSDFERREGEGSMNYAARIFERVYNSDIESVLSMEVDCLPTPREGGGGGWGS